MSLQYSSRAVTISYFDPFDVFESIKGEFLQLLPFRNIHWKAPGGSVRTVRQLPVNLVVESEASELGVDDVNLFVRFIVVNCISVDDYRGKVRPLLRQWLPVSEGMPLDNDAVETPKPIVLLYANSEVVDSNLFKSISLIDKFAKDFPGLKTLELKSVYKSPGDKGEFWTQMGNNLKSCLLDIFQKRLSHYRRKLSISNNTDEELSLQEKILELYLALNMHEESTAQLNKIRDNVVTKRQDSLPDGELETPFNFSGNEILDDRSIAKMLLENKLTKFQYFKYFFVKKFQLLNMGKTNNSRLLLLYKLIRGFLHSIDAIFRNSTHLLEFKYYFIENALDCINSGDLPMFMEMKAELLLLKRDCWIQGVLSNTDYHIIGKEFPKVENHYLFGRLKDTFINEDIFHENFIKFTSQLVSLYNRYEGKRQRIVDVLSLEIGMLHYQRGEYDRAVSLFDSCYEYYMESNWDVIALQIIKMFYQSLVHCKEIKSLKRDEEEMSTPFVLSNAFLDIMRVTGDNEEKKQAWSNFLNIQKKMDKSPLYGTERLFDIKTSNFTYQSEPNVYRIDVTIRNLALPLSIDADSVKLIMKSSLDEFIEFSAKNVTILPSSNYYSLEAFEISYGQFQPVSLEINTGNATFSLEFLEEVKSIFIEPLNHAENVSCAVQQSKLLYLGEYAVDLIQKNVKDLQSLEVEITVEPNNLSYPISFSSDSNAYSKTITDIRDCTTLQYFSEEPITSFGLKTKSTFYKKGNPRKFSETRIFTISCYLPVSVSVEDIFKKDAFIFKFLLNSSTAEEPIILYTSKLKATNDSGRYEWFGDYEPSDFIYLTADPAESSLNCYQITTNDKFDPNDMFELQVTYNTMKEQLDGLVTDCILVQGDVAWYSEFELWKILWETKILPSLQYDYNAFMQSCMVLVLPDSLDVAQMYDSLVQLNVPITVSRRILSSLKKIIEGVELSDIDIRAYAKNLIPRKLVVPVELPEMDHFFHVEFVKKHSEQYRVGTPMLFTIKVENLSQKWGSQGISGAFVLEIASSNEWLAHGRKRMLIRSEASEFELYIIPLKKGYLNFPRVEISNVTNGESSRIDNPNASETILVL